MKPQQLNSYKQRGHATCNAPLSHATTRGDSVMKIKPLGDRILVERFEAEGKTTGGILLPDSAKNKPQKGKVLSVGPGKVGKDGKYTALDLKEGDTVLFTNWAGDEFKEAHGENILLM